MSLKGVLMEREVSRAVPIPTYVKKFHVPNIILNHCRIGAVVTLL